MFHDTIGSGLIEIPVPYRLLIGSGLGIDASTIECSSFKPPHYLPSSIPYKHTKHEECCMQINELLTKSRVELEDDTNLQRLPSATENATIYLPDP